MLDSNWGVPRWSRNIGTMLIQRTDQIPAKQPAVTADYVNLHKGPGPGVVKGCHWFWPVQIWALLSQLQNKASAFIFDLLTQPWPRWLIFLLGLSLGPTLHLLSALWRNCPVSSHALQLPRCLPLSTFHLELFRGPGPSPWPLPLCKQSCHISVKSDS